MNARISVPPVAVPHQPHDAELEAETIGLMLLGYPVPEWLDVDDFFAGQHRAIFRAARELGETANLVTVGGYLRDLPPTYGPPVATSTQLFALVNAAEVMLRLGWAVDFAKLRELRNQRRLLEAMRRVEIAFEHEAMSHREARKALSEHFERSSK